MAMVETYGVGRQTASWPFSLAPATACFATIIAGVLSRYMSARQSCLCGGTFAFLGVALCFVAPSIAWFAVFFGVIFGLGIALSVPLLVGILNEYFVRHRATANGIYLSGSTLGLFCLPPLLEYMVATYGLKGTMLIQSALVAHMLLGAALLRPRTPDSFPVLRLKRNPFLQSKTKADDTDLPNSAVDESHVLTTLIEEPEEPPVVMRLDSETGSFRLLPVANGEDAKLIEAANNDINKIKANGETDRVKSGLHPSDAAEADFRSTRKRSISRRASSISGSFAMLESIGSLPKPDPNGKPRNYISLMLEIFKDPYFYLVVVSAAACIIPLLTFMVVIMDFGLDKGLPKERAVLLMSVISIPELIGRLSFGWISDRGWLKYKTIFMISKGLAAILLFLLPEVTNEAGLFVIASFYGAIESCAAIILNVLFVEYMGLEKLTIAFSWSIFLNGFIFLSMPYVIGTFRDEIGSYDYLFYAMGALCLVATSLWLLEPAISRRKSKMAALAEDKTQEA